MNITSVHRIDTINLFLLILSFFVAIIIPFELFLFAYAILGPLHYLTEISWLHEREYFTTGKRDALLLILISCVIVLDVFKNEIGLADLEITSVTTTRLLFISFFSAMFFALLRNVVLKWIAIFMVVLISSLSDNMIIFYTVFVPTLLHVFVFTFLFMLLGALKSRSIFGYICVIIHLLCPFVLYFFLQDVPAQEISNYAKNAYNNFIVLNAAILQNFMQINSVAEGQELIYHSKIGITIMRFIAFSYTYHYLNWFSKTEIIRWYKIPVWKLAVIVVLWIVSIALYGIEYRLGLKWLFMLSILHVLLELPLNFLSFRNIVLELCRRIPFKADKEIQPLRKNKIKKES